MLCSKWRLIKASVLVATLTINGCSFHKKPELVNYASKQLNNFSSEKEFNDYLKIAHRLNQYRDRLYAKEHEDGDEQKIVVTGSRLTNQPTPITNNQVSGVDEGDIIKLVDNYLIVLRRGKLFSISLKEGNLDSIRPISKIDITPPGWNYDSWYDEMLVLDQTILVLGYSYDLEASELLRYHIDDYGKLSYKDGFLISSGDYFSLENYASRLYQGKYITYIPSVIYDEDTYHRSKRKPGFPRIAKILGSNKNTLRWKELVNYQDIRKPLQHVLYPTLHTILTCDPLSEDFSCEAKGIISSGMSEYYVSKDSFYLWTQAFSKELLYDYNFDDEFDYRFQLDDVKNISHYLEAVVFKVSLESDEITAARVSGQPVNQFSFHERNGSLHMLLIDGISADKKEAASLYSIPLEYFNRQGSYIADHIKLGPVNEEINNRFTSDHLIIGTSSTFNYSRQEGNKLKPTFNVSIYDLDNHNLSNIITHHSSDRLEPVGNNLFVSGLTKEGNLAVTIIDPENMTKLTSKEFPTILEQETRSHAFNSYLASDDTILMGITTVNKKDAKRKRGLFDYYWDDNQSSDVFFIGLDRSKQLYKAGKLESNLGFNANDIECKVSCYDWYGNTRPFFIGDRIFGLSGDELLEGNYSNGYVDAMNRIDIRASK